MGVLAQQAAEAPTRVQAVDLDLESEFKGLF